jgi:mannose-6-phosphate isomerase-like protein (cupin superfamily)
MENNTFLNKMADSWNIFNNKKRGFINNIERDTIKNKNFRKVFYTAPNSQLVLMSLHPDEEIGAEIHQTRDQFFRFESGNGIIIINGHRNQVTDGSAVLVPAGAMHNVINTGRKDLKFYAIYSPPEHLDKIVRKTKMDAEKRHYEYNGFPTE